MSDIRLGYTRVSEILGRLRDRSGINQLVLKDKADIGTEVHHNIHMNELGVPAHFDTFPVRNPITGKIMREEERGAGYFDSYLVWLEQSKVAYNIMEQRFYDDDLMITGQIDATGVIDGKTHLIDFKCSYEADLKVWPMQAHFYWHLLKLGGFTVDSMLFVQLKKDGSKPRVYEFTFDQNILSECIEEAVRYQEEKNLALMLD